MGGIGNGGKPCSWRELKSEDMQWSATTNRTTQAKSRGQLASYNFLFKLADTISSSVRSSLCNPAPQETCSNCLDFHLVQRHSVITVALNCHHIMSGNSRYKQTNKGNNFFLTFKTLFSSSFISTEFVYSFWQYFWLHDGAHPRPLAGSTFFNWPDLLRRI